jgi:hypothetical protein
VLVESLAKNGKRGFENYRDFSSLSGLPAGLLARVLYNLFTAADEKIALSVVRVNKKPQYLVFCCHFRHLLAKHRQLPVESSKRPCMARTSDVDSAPFSVQRPGALPGRPKHQPSPPQVPEQGAKTVQFAHAPVRIVEIADISWVK